MMHALFHCLLRHGSGLLYSNFEKLSKQFMYFYLGGNEE